MRAPEDHDEILLKAGGLPAALIRNKDRVATLFQERIHERIPAAREERSPIIINTLPAFLTRLGLALLPGNEIDFASEYSNLAFAHGNERAKLTGYSLAELVREYQVLREVITEVLAPVHEVTAPEWAIIHRSIDEAIAEAAGAFMQVHQNFRDVFTAALSHDFRGPLANALNYLDLIRRDAEPGQHGHFATRALFNLRRIDRMIHALLDAMRANAGARLAIHVEPCEAGSLVRDVVGDLALRAGDRFSLHIEDAVQGFWDADRIKQAVQNLLENALKYGADDTPITCRVVQSKGRLLVSVHNLGDPIPPEIIPVLFQPFRRSLSAERSPKDGWGLGLMMVQAIAEAHGGSVAVESTRSEGTIFTLDVLVDARES
jgi:signal transduction histidine kinase